MKLLIITLLISSCASTKPFKTTHFKMTKKVVGYQCPDQYYLGNDYLCHRNTQFKPITIKTKVNTKANPIKPLKKAKKHVKIDCKQVLKDINQCSGGF